MSFLLPCPNCGMRRVDEFTYGGELQLRPSATVSAAAWGQYLYGRRNVAGMQTEWWYHRLGCGRWFLAERDTVTNEVQRTFWRSPDEPMPVLLQGAKVLDWRTIP
jgi:heterotetrameric sarcosine oxidase delta subunit